MISIFFFVSLFVDEKNLLSIWIIFFGFFIWFFFIRWLVNLFEVGLMIWLLYEWSVFRFFWVLGWVNIFRFIVGVIKIGVLVER